MSVSELNDSVHDLDIDVDVEEEFADTQMDKIRQDLLIKHKALEKRHRDVALQLASIKSMSDRNRIDLRLKTQKLMDVERSLSTSEEKVKVLEAKARELERVEVQVELSRRQIYEVEQQLSDERYYHGETRAELEETTCELESSRRKIEQQAEFITDLKTQVQEELRKNDKLEKDLLSLGSLERQHVEDKREIMRLQEEVENKSVLLCAARKRNADLKDKSQSLVSSMQRFESSKDEVDRIQQENSTLKKVILGKDTLLIRQAQSLQKAQTSLARLRQGKSTREPQTKFIRATYPGSARSCRGSTRSAHSRIYTSGTSDTISEISSDLSHNNSDLRHGRVISAPVQRTDPASLLNDPDILHDLEINLDDFYTDKLDNDPDDVVARKNVRSKGKSKMYQSFYNFVKDQSAGMTDDQKDTQKKMKMKQTDSKKAVTGSGKKKRNADVAHPVTMEVKDVDGASGPEPSKLEKDCIFARFVQVGDRVMVRFGKKRDRSQILHGAVVRYIGQLDKECRDYRLYVGLRLDECVGDTDGVYKNTRYFNVPIQFGKILKITRVVSVFNPQTREYLHLDDRLIRATHKSVVAEMMNATLMN